MANLKMTGFGRLVVFLLIISPLVYFGMKYLKSSGTLDKMKEKVEQKQADRDLTSDPEQASDGGILGDLDRQREGSASNNQNDIIAEQKRKIEELERQNQELKNRRESSNPSSVPPIQIPEPKLDPTSSSNNNGGTSLDDLVREAENNMREKGNIPGTSGSQSDSPRLDNSRKTLATWTFSFNSINGVLELFQQGNKLMSRTAYHGTNRVDIQELVEQSNRLYVVDSPTREYYTLRENGDLDAYDNSGFLTTCRRQ